LKIYHNTDATYELYHITTYKQQYKKSSMENAGARVVQVWHAMNLRKFAKIALI